MTKNTKAKAEQLNPHRGHRERMRRKFLEFGIDVFSDHEVLEFLLFQIHTRRDTNLLAHTLLDQFGSLHNVFYAHFDDLRRIDGIGDVGAAYLKFIPELLGRFDSEEICRVPLKSPKQLCRYFSNKLEYETEEVVLLALMNDREELIDSKIVGRGTPGKVSINHRQLMRCICLSRCTCAVIGHNHPAGLAIPSEQDLAVTDQLKILFDTVGVTLLDHIIVGTDQTISMREKNCFIF